MAAVTPKLIVRLGSHAEKEYIEKTLNHLDGLILGANLMEATPGATSSLILKCATRWPRPLPVYIDPMTYAYGAYRDRQTGITRTDLDWIKSEQNVKLDPRSRPRRRKPEEKLEQEGRFKRSYRKLAAKYEGLFKAALEHERSISLADFTDPGVSRVTAEKIIEYQLTRAREEFSSDPDFTILAEAIRPPEAVFAPYFYMEPNDPRRWLSVNARLAADAVAVSGGRHPVHAILCVDQAFLLDQDLVRAFGTEVPATGVAGVWLWFSKFREDGSEPDAVRKLIALRRLVETLAAKTEVYALHGGFFSIALSRVGLAGVSHGIGYGEQKDVMPIIGQSTPTVRYYLRPLRTREGALEVERSFTDLGVNTPADFLRKVCDCAICAHVVGEGLANFAVRFGEKHYSTPQSLRQAQTPEAAKLCRFHFLLSRFKERDWVKTATLDQIRDTLAIAKADWGTLPWFETEHLEWWRSALA
jgi:hypothetical protein